MGAASHSHALPCQGTAQPKEPRAKLWDAGTNCKSQLVHPANTFDSLPVIPRNSSSISVLARCSNQSQDQARDSFGARNQGFRDSQVAAGRGKCYGMAWLQPPTGT